MSKALAAKEESALAVSTDFVDVAGFDDLGPEDFSLPRMILVQSQHVHEGAEKHPGEWYRTDTNEHIENPRVLVIGIAKSRAMFDPDNFSRDSEPLCRSDDGYKPRMEYVGTRVNGVAIPQSCMSCPHGEWNGDTAPACQLADNWAALSEEGEPVIFRMKGSGMKVSKQLKNVIRVARARKRPTYSELGSVREVGDQGNYFVPSFQIVREVPPDEVLEMAKELAGINLASRAAEVSDFDNTNGVTIGGPEEPPFRGYTDADYQPEAADVPF